ncbi:stealth family protein, partial [Nocardiopsis coralliicola]
MTSSWTALRGIARNAARAVLERTPEDVLAVPNRVLYRRLLDDPDLELVRHHGRLVIARRHTGPMSSEAFAQQALDACVAVLEAAGIPYFLVKGRDHGGFSIGVSRGQRRRIVELLIGAHADRGLYGMAVGARRDYLRPLAARGALERLSRADAVLVGSFATGDGQHAAIGPEHGCTVEFWRSGASALDTESGQALLSRLKVVAPETTLRGALVAPRQNMVSEIVPAEEREARSTEIRGRRYTTFDCFLRPLPEEAHFPVDAVYTWVDGDDPEWQAKRDRHLGGSGELNPTSASSSRYTARDELRYSLRSLEMYAGFVRDVYIVTDGQCPPWLRATARQVQARTGRRVRVVDHKEIFADPSVLPVFNSHAIETQLHHIEGLSEHYIYLNDDMFFGRHTTPTTFFHPNGIAKVFPSPFQFGLGAPLLDDQPVDVAAKNNRRLLAADFPAFPTHKFKHAPYPQLRSVLEELEAHYPAEFARTAASRFRRPEDIAVASSLHHTYALLTGRAVPSKVRSAYVNLADREGLAGAFAALLHNRHPETICTNDTSPVEDEEYTARQLRAFLDAYFPFPSSLELDRVPDDAAMDGTRSAPAELGAEAAEAAEAAQAARSLGGRRTGAVPRPRRSARHSRRQADRDRAFEAGHAAGV